MSADSHLKSHLTKVADGHTLTREEAEDAMRTIMSGEADPQRTAGLLLGLRARGETVEELTGFTAIMREFALPVEVEDEAAIDLCGTGGDTASTFNISTTASLVAAGAGATVAKHGNRSVSSQSGSADVLEEFGVVIDLGKEGVERCLREVGISFIFAPNFHPAMKHVMPIRKNLGVRTCFNILGPLSNPAGVRRQLVGAFSPEVAETMADILRRLGGEHVVTVHGKHGMDELSTVSPTTLYESRRRDGSSELPEIESRTVRPEDHDLESAQPEALAGGSAAENARILEAILEGETGPRRDVVVLNAGYALHASGRYDTLEDALEAARESIDSGAAREKLDRLAAVSQAAAQT